MAGIHALYPTRRKGERVGRSASYYQPVFVPAIEIAYLSNLRRSALPRPYRVLRRIQARLRLESTRKRSLGRSCSMKLVYLYDLFASVYAQSVTLPT